MTALAIQDYYPEEFSHCFGCGSKNAHGHQIKSMWDGEQAHLTFKPDASQMAVPGFVYGGLIASLMDCHCVGTAAAAASKRDGIDITKENAPRFVTASLSVTFLAPTPLGPPLEIRAWPTEITDRKIRVEAELSVDGKVCAKGEVVAAPLPEAMAKKMMEHL